MRTRWSIIACLYPLMLTGQSFTDEAFSRGLIFQTSFGSFPAAYGSGVGLIDLDGDGDLDAMLVGSGTGVVGVFENSGGGQFIDRSAGTGIVPTIHLSGICAADYDADGDLDVYVTNWVGPNLLLRNEGGFTFLDVASSAGVADDGPGTGSCFGDFDGDGWVDLYLVNRTGQYGAPGSAGNPNRLYRNLQNGTFQEVGAMHGVDNEYAGFQAIFFDYDRDGDADLYLSNDRGDYFPDAGNRLWQNDNGTFVDVSSESGTYLQINSMGVAVGDLDRNGFLDLYVTNTADGNPLFLNQGDRTFVDQADRWGVTVNSLGWGTHFLDVDHDAHSDLFVANWYWRNFLFTHDGTTPCLEVGLAAGFTDTNPTLCTAIGDIDLDGDIDLLVQNFTQPTRLFVHGGTPANWIVLRLVGDLPNAPAIGATVDLRAGANVQTQAVLAGSGFKSMSTLALHFGVGTSTTVDEISVTWPDGTRSIRRDVPANQYFEIRQSGSGFPDCNGNGSPDAQDLLSGSSVDTNGNGLPDECEPLFLRGDADGGGAVDIGDAIAALATLFGDRISLCREALDANDDGQIDLADPIRLLMYLFGGGDSLSPPTGSCGIDLTTLGGPGLGCIGARQSCP